MMSIRYEIIILNNIKFYLSINSLSSEQVSPAAPATAGEGVGGVAAAEGVGGAGEAAASFPG